jgi:hypothetical protein
MYSTAQITCLFNKPSRLKDRVQGKQNARHYREDGPPLQVVLPAFQARLAEETCCLSGRREYIGITVSDPASSGFAMRCNLRGLII